MSVLEITKKIITDAEEKSREIVEEAEREVREIERETQKLEVEVKEKEQEKTEKVLKDSKRVALSRANQEARMLLDKAKRDALDQFYQSVFKTLSDLPDEKYKKVLESLFSKVDMGKTEELKVLVPHSRKDVSLSFLKENGLDTSSVEETESFIGGMKIVGKDFGFDLTFETLVKNLKEEREAEIASQIFS